MELRPPEQPNAPGAQRTSKSVTAPPRSKVSRDERGRVLKRERVMVSKVAVRAAQLLGAVRRGSELAIDAFLVATADVHRGALIATVDVRDLRRLAGHAHGVRIAC